MSFHEKNFTTDVPSCPLPCLTRSISITSHTNCLHEHLEEEPLLAINV